MKILVVSLLRLGDILLATSVLRSLRRENPRADIHILINGQFKSVTNLIPFVNKVYCFDRNGIQEIIGRSEHSLLEAYFRIEDLVEQLQTERYDKVINLTHNRLSGWLTALIGCADTQGVVFGTNGRFSMGSSWFDYLNDITENARQNAFHFVDVFHYGSGLEGADRRIELVETPEGKNFAMGIFKNSGRRQKVLIQPGTSEAKKTFSPEKWKQIAAMIRRAENHADVYILGAPAEAELVKSISEGQNFIPVICNLEQAYSVLLQGHLLVTGDTSIKHLACATKIKILEVSLGSSQFEKTGAYTNGAVIIQSRAPCAPCSHRGPCGRDTHECAEKIPPELVSLAAEALLRQDEAALRVLAHEYREEAEMLRTSINASGDWAAVPLSGRFSAREISPWIDRASFKLFLQKTHEKRVGEFGSEGMELKQLLQSIFPDQSWREWVSELKNLEQDIVWFDERLGEYLGKLRDLLPQIDNIHRLGGFLDDLEGFTQLMEKSPLLESYGRQMNLTLQEVKPAGLPFQTVKKLREKLSTARQRTKIELKLIRGLQTGFMEIL